MASKHQITGMTGSGVRGTSSGDSLLDSDWAGGVVAEDATCGLVVVTGWSNGALAFQPVAL